MYLALQLAMCSSLLPRPSSVAAQPFPIPGGIHKNWITLLLSDGQHSVGCKPRVSLRLKRKIPISVNQVPAAPDNQLVYISQRGSLNTTYIYFLCTA